MLACIREAATEPLLVEKDPEVESHVADGRGVSWHGASEGNHEAWSRRVVAAVLDVVWGHVFEDSSVHERPDGALVRQLQSAADLAADAVAPRLKHVMEAEVEVLPPRCREFALALLLPPDLMLALQNVSAFNKTGGDAPAVLLVVPAIDHKMCTTQLSLSQVIIRVNKLQCITTVVMQLQFVLGPV